MQQRFRRWVIVATVAMTLGARTTQAAFTAPPPPHTDQYPADRGGSPPHKKCGVSSSASGLMQPGSQCGW